MQREDKIMKFTDENIVELLTEIVRLNIFDSKLRDITQTTEDLPCTWSVDNLIRIFLDVSGLDKKLNSEQIDQVFGVILDVDINVIGNGGNVYSQMSDLWDVIQNIK